MNRIVEALKQTGIFYLATIDGDQARVRPVSAVEEIDGAIYISTNRTKEMYRQMMASPKIELCGMAKGSWLRVSCTAVRDDSDKTRDKFLELAPVIKNWCHKGDGVFDYGILEVIRLENPRAVRYSMNKVPESIEE